MRYNLLKWQMDLKKGAFIQGFIPRVTNVVGSVLKPHSDALKAVFNYVDELGKPLLDGQDKILSCQEEITLIDLLFKATLGEEKKFAEDRQFAQEQFVGAALGEKNDYFLEAGQLTQKAAEIYKALLELRSDPMLVRPKFFRLIRSVSFCHLIPPFLSNFSSEKIQSISETLITTIINTDKAKPDFIPALQRLNPDLLTIAVIKAFSASSRDSLSLVSLYNQAYSLQLVGEWTYPILNCPDFSPAIILNLLKHIATLQLLDANICRFTHVYLGQKFPTDPDSTKLKELLQKIKNNDLNQPDLIPEMINNIYQIENFIDGLVTLKQANLLNGKTYPLLYMRTAPRDVAKVLVILHELNELETLLSQPREQLFSLHKLLPHLIEWKDKYKNASALKLMIEKRDVMPEIVLFLAEKKFLSDRAIELIKKLKPEHYSVLQSKLNSGTIASEAALIDILSSPLALYRKNNLKLSLLPPPPTPQTYQASLHQLSRGPE